MAKILPFKINRASVACGQEIKKGNKDPDTLVTLKALSRLPSEELAFVRIISFHLFFPTCVYRQNKDTKVKRNSIA